MSLGEFIKMCQDLLGNGSLYSSPKMYGNLWTDGSKTKKQKEQEDKDPDAPYLYVYWTTGGVGGGSCWDTGEPNLYPVSGDPPAELVDLDKILEKVKPEIGFLQYKMLVSTLVEVADWTQDEYYGNSTSYMSKALSLPKLHAYMLEKGWLE